MSDDFVIPEGDGDKGTTAYVNPKVDDCPVIPLGHEGRDVIFALPEGSIRREPAGRIPVLPYGDELTLQTASKDVSSFDSFMRSILRLIAASLDVTYEELSMDYSQTNYSSARAALIHAWSATVALKDVWPVIRPPFRADVSIGFVESFDYL